jgi:hypothetical protein
MAWVACNGAPEEERDQAVPMDDDTDNGLPVPIPISRVRRMTTAKPMTMTERPEMTTTRQ